MNRSAVVAREAIHPEGTGVNLALSASRAALSLESRLADGGSSIDAVRELAKQLRASASPPAPTEAARAALLNLEATAFWVRTLQRERDSFKNVEAVLTAANDLLRRLENISDAGDRHEFELLRDECLRISNTAQQEFEPPFHTDDERLAL